MKANNNKKIIKKIVLAAGQSKRYGKKNKLTEIFYGKPLINNIIEVLLKIFEPNELLIIVGYQHKKIIKLINNSEIQIIKNTNFKNGIGSSISTAVKHLKSHIQGVMIIPADMPLLSECDIKKLEITFLKFNCEKVVLPKSNSKFGNPVILPKSYFQILKNLSEDHGAKSLINKKDIVTIDAKAGTIFDVDTEEELHKANKLV